MKYPKHIICDLNPLAEEYDSWNWIDDYKQLIFAEYDQIDTIEKAKFMLPDFNEPLISNKLEHKALLEILNQPMPRKPDFDIWKIVFVQPITFELFDINFLKKDFLYTKLKYSRCPQYDIVSGGLAALLAGFIGFLISEKFGIELVDSGDFYIAWMYGAFLSMAIGLFSYMYMHNEFNYNVFDINYTIIFYLNIFNLLYKKLNTLMNKKQQKKNDK